VWSGYASDQRSNVKKFLSVVAEMGLPGFSVKDLEEVRLLLTCYAIELQCYHAFQLNTALVSCEAVH
jgi:hypothetical protein